MARKTEKSVTSTEKDLDSEIKKGTISKQPKKKKLETIKKEDLSVDQLAASKRIVKFHPKSKTSMIKKLEKILHNGDF